MCCSELLPQCLQTCLAAATRVCCKVLHRVAMCCDVLQRVTAAMFADMPRGSNRGVLQCVAVCCSVLQCVAVSYRRFVCRHASRLQQEIIAVWRSVLQCVAVWRSVLQCVVVFCNERLLLCLPSAHHTPVSYCNTLHDAAPNCNTLQHTAHDSNTLQRSRPHGASCLPFCCVGVFPFFPLEMRRTYNECIVPGVSQCFVPLN